MSNQPTPIRARASLGLCFVLALALAGCSPGAPTSGASAAAIASPAPSIGSAQPSATAVKPAESIATPSAPASAGPLPDGDYVSGVVTKAMAQAVFKDEKVADDPAVKQFLDGFGAKGESRSTMRLASGRWTQFVEQDGKDEGVGEEGTYAFVDDHTIVLQSTHLPSTVTFEFSLRGETLKWTVRKDSLGAADLAVVRVIFESTPWTRKP